MAAFNLTIVHDVQWSINRTFPQGLALDSDVCKRSRSKIHEVKHDNTCTGESNATVSMCIRRPGCIRYILSKCLYVLVIKSAKVTVTFHQTHHRWDQLLQP